MERIYSFEEKKNDNKNRNKQNTSTKAMKPQKKNTERQTDTHTYTNDWIDCVLIVICAEQIRAIIEKFNYAHIMRHGLVWPSLHIEMCQWQRYTIIDSNQWRNGLFHILIALCDEKVIWKSNISIGIKVWFVFFPSFSRSFEYAHIRYDLETCFEYLIFT